jgi:hypothetical protein
MTQVATNNAGVDNGTNSVYLLAAGVGRDGGSEVRNCNKETIGIADAASRRLRSTSQDGTFDVLTADNRCGLPGSKTHRDVTIDRESSS